MERPILRGARVTLRRPREADDDALAGLLGEPEVSRAWWGYDRERVIAEMIEDDDEVVVLAIEHGGRVIGAIQYGEELDPMYRHASIDLFLGSAWHGKGLGTESIRLVLDHLFDALGHHRAVIDPAADNAPAIRAYERVGFRPVGVMRKYERGADGTFHDGLLMEMLAEDRPR